MFFIHVLSSRKEKSYERKYIPEQRNIPLKTAKEVGRAAKNYCLASVCSAETVLLDVSGKKL